MLLVRYLKTGYMYALIIRFEIPDTKIHEFNVFTSKLKEWPLYGQYHGGSSNAFKEFVVIKNWSSRLELKSDLNGRIYENLLAAINVLGRNVSQDLLETLETSQLNLG